LIFNTMNVAATNQGHYVLTTISRLVTSRMIYRVLVAITIIMVSKYIIADPILADKFEVANSASNIIMIGSEIGMSMVLMRYAAKKRAEDLPKYYGTALTIETIAWLVLLVVGLGGCALFYGFTTLFWLLLILSINQAIIQYRVVIRSIYRSLHHAERITYIEVADGLSKVIGIWYITHTISNPTLGAYVIAIVFTATTLLFIGIYGLHSFTLVKPQLAVEHMPNMVREGIWYSLQGVIMSLYFEVDKLVMWVLQGNHWANLPNGDIASYGAASRIIIFFLIFHRIGLQAITPYLYSSYPDHLDRYRRIVRFSTRYMSAVGIGLGAGIIALAKPLLHLIYSGKFDNSALALQFFGLFLIVRFIGITSSQVLATTGKQPLRTRQEAYGVVLNIVLDLILIPLYGFMGGAIASLITELVMQVIFFIMTRRLIQDQIWSSLWQIMPAVLAGSVMGLAVHFAKPYVSFYLLPLAGAVLYFALLYLFKFFSKADFKLLRKEKAV